MIGFASVKLNFLSIYVDLLWTSSDLLEPRLGQVIIGGTLFQSDSAGKHGDENYLLDTNPINRKRHASFQWLRACHDIEEGEHFVVVIFLCLHPIPKL